MERIHRNITDGAVDTNLRWLLRQMCDEMDTINERLDMHAPKGGVYIKPGDIVTGALSGTRYRVVPQMRRGMATVAWNNVDVPSYALALYGELLKDGQPVLGYEGAK